MSDNQQPCLTIRAVVTTEDIDEELVSQEPLLLVPEELSMSTSLAKEQLAPMLAAANLPSLEVHCFILCVAKTTRWIVAVCC